MLSTASLHLVRGFATAGLKAGTLGLCQKVKICSPRYLARGWAVLEVKVLMAKDFASLNNILIFSGVCFPVKLKFVRVACCEKN